MDPVDLLDRTTIDDADAYPTLHEERTHYCFAAVFEPTGKIYSDLTGKFVSPSSTGNNYILIVYDYDSNKIKPVPMKSRSKLEHLKAFKIATPNLSMQGSAHASNSWTTNVPKC